MRVLCIAAHPDDEALGCGATLAKHKLAGDEVHILLAVARNLYIESENARIALGANLTVTVGFSDQKLDTFPRLSIIQRIEQQIQTLRPDIVYTHSCWDRNLDHRIIADAVLTACRPLPGSTIKRILAFEVPSSTEWGQGFEPNVFVGVAGEPMQRKMKALECYRSEMRQFPHPRSSEGVLALATWRGSTAGLEQAEAFVLMRAIE